MSGGQSATTWVVTESEGLDAVAFLGALSGADFYVREYEAETTEFSARLSPEVLADLRDLREQATTSGFGLLWPNLANIVSAAPTDTIGDVLVALERLEQDVLPGYASSQFWDKSDWRWLTTAAPRITNVMAALRDADFASFRAGLAGSTLDARARTLPGELADYDVVSWARKLSGKGFEPTVTILLLYFCRPHGVRIQGQRFIQSPDFDVRTTVRVAAHELLHPPIDMAGPVARGVLETLASDPLIPRIVREHDVSLGYTTLEGLFNEDLCQAVDQLILEQLDVARDPADRWREADGGIHVLAAALYGLLRADSWADQGGGDVGEWLGRALEDGRLAPAVLRQSAADVLRRPADELWPPLDV